jgi:myo-inositol 2-dehydrogenase/D-chiro-inositol 1-dehydrogenase
VTRRRPPGAIATAEANFNAVYGYDVRNEAFGWHGMVTGGDIRRTTMTHYGATGVVSESWRRNIDLFHDVYVNVNELAHFAWCVRTGTTPRVTGDDACAALIAVAAIRSVNAGRPVRIDEIDDLR